MQTRILDFARVHASQEFAKSLLIMAAAGGAAFRITDFLIAVSPIAALYKAAFSITSLPVALVEALAGGMAIAFSVSFFLLRFYSSLPGKNPIFKASILSFGAMIIVEVLSAFADPAHASIYLLPGTGMNAPRFLALALVIGCIFDTQNKKG